MFKSSDFTSTSYEEVFAIRIMSQSEFSEDVPYIVAVIDLQEGVRMMSNIVGCLPETVKCDMEVEVIFDDVTKEITLPKFKPIT